MSHAEIANTPHVPPEIWLRIIEWATFVPYAFDTHAPDKFAYPARWSQDEIQAALLNSTSTKRSLTLVCQTWNSLATRFLYEAISVSHWTILRRLLRSLDDGLISGSADAESARGRWTRRLSIMLPLDSSGTKFELAQIVQRLPNLEIIIIRQRYEWKDLVSSEVACIFNAFTTRSLHVLDYFGGSTQEDYKMMEIIKDQPLRVLTIHGALTFETDQKMVVPNIQYLDVPGQFLSPILDSTTPPPSLSSLSITLWFCPKSCSTERTTHRSLSCVGRSLTTVEIADYFWFHDGEDTFEAAMRDISKTCPNLRYLVLIINNPSHTIHAHSIPPVEKVGIYWTKTGYSKWWNGLYDNLVSLMLFTTVKVVRLLEPPLLLGDTLCPPPDVAINFRRLSMASLERGVRLEDYTGELIHAS